MKNKHNDEQCRDELKRRFGENIKKRQWNKIARVLGVNRGLVALVYDGKTRSNKMRTALGMSLLSVPVVPCRCGKIHIHECKHGNNIAHRDKSTNPETLTFIQEIVVPFLIERTKNEQTQNRKNRKWWRFHASNRCER